MTERPHPHWLFRARFAADRDSGPMADGGRERVHEWARDWHETREEAEP